jgi:glycosyl hydrolase family 57
VTAVPIAFVHHANQFVITDGYADRDGISVTAAGYDAVLSLHVELGVPAALHISGPVLEAIAWHRPALLARLRRHLASGLVTLVGGTYGENVMPLSSPRHNRRQLRAFHDLAEDLLEVPRGQLKTAWVPERVWATAACAPPLRDADATGVAYQRVLLDDRLAHPLREGRYPGSARESFDAAGPYRWHSDGFPASARGQLQAGSLAPYRIAGGDGLVAVPIASHLRYLVPPHDPDHLRLLTELAGDAQQAQEGSLLVFADDLERVAGVAGWEQGLERYARFLRWLTRSDALQPVGLDAWCDQVDPASELPVEAGTYYELAHQHGAGEDYGQWAGDPRWRPYAERLDRVEAALEQAEGDAADPGLCALAERLLLLGRHETAWQDPDTGGGRAPAPWVRATAAHAADALPVLAAARWAADPTPHGLRVLVADVDEDGDDEVVLSSDRMFAVLSPRHGGRLSLLVRRDPDTGTGTTPRATVVVGNPADHWNFQTVLHQHMQAPPNHPGALAVLGTEAHRHDLGRVEVTSRTAVVELIDVEPGPDRGLTKQVLLTADGTALVVCVRRSGLPGELRTTVALSPDYPALLRAGRHHLALDQGRTWWSASTATLEAWVAHDPAEHTDQLVATSPATGHALTGAVDGCGRHLHLVLGTGPVHDGTGPALIAAADRQLHPAARAEQASTVPAGSGTR